MKIQKLPLSKEKKDINLKFYFFLKNLVKISPNNNQINLIIENLSLLKNSKNEIILEELNKIFKLKVDIYSQKKALLNELVLKFENSTDIVLFIFAAKLYSIKDLLLKEAKLSQSADLEKLSNLDPLSLEYDKISILKPYQIRVNGALLASLFFEKINKGITNFMSQDCEKYLLELSKTAIELKKSGLDSNQIFMLIFAETIDQSIISESGSNYENRIMSVLNKNGILDVKKIHDKNDKSTEFDFFFEIDGKTYGIGAKRTLRERYKQFIKTAITSKIDVMIQVTTGLDLNEEKAKTIIGHGTYIFVSDEIYKSQKFLQHLNGVYSAKELNLKTLKNLK